MITIEKIVITHHFLIDMFGGSKGVRDNNGLEAAIARPYATFDAVDLYPSAIEKAAAICESLVINHPFIDGNKRIAYTTMKLILLDANLNISAHWLDSYNIIIKASQGLIHFDEIKAWLETNTSSI